MHFHVLDNGFRQVEPVFRAERESDVRQSVLNGFVGAREFFPLVASGAGLLEVGLFEVLVGSSKTFPVIDKPSLSEEIKEGVRRRGSCKRPDTFVLFMRYFSSVQIRAFCRT